MSNTITVIGNLAADPEIQFTPSGKAVANFTVAQTPRKFDRQTNEWKDAGEANYFRCTAWEKVAENIAESLKKGDRVVVIGSLSTRKYKTKAGEDATSTNNLNVEEVGPSLKYQTTVGTKNTGGGGNNYNNGGGNGYGNNGGGNNYGGGNNGGGYNNSVANSQPSNGFDSEPPF